MYLLNTTSHAFYLLGFVTNYSCFDSSLKALNVLSSLFGGAINFRQHSLTHRYVT